MGTNTKYKDSVFSLLFSDPDLLRELYCALEDVTLPADIPVTINTLQNVFFQNMMNDISFEIGGKLIVLIEHQSTINENMPLRLLMYIARVYEKIIGDRNIYATKRVCISRPEFFVLYNGVTPIPNTQILKLSDAFEKVGIMGIPEKENVALELEVKVININQGENEAILWKSKTLSEYSVFVAKIRELEKRIGDRSRAMEMGIKQCRDNGILKDFLEKHGTEVINMLMTEWNLDDALAVRFEEGMEQGIEKGREEIARNALAQGASVDFVQKITGLDLQAVKSLSP